jgi:hypothetical protein
MPPTPGKNNPATGSASEATYFHVFIMMLITVLAFFIFKELREERDEQ